MKAELTREVAEKMYKSDDESVRAFALSNYPDLEVKALPKTWEELESVKGAYIDANSRIVDSSHYTLGTCTNNFNKNTYPTLELAEAALALAQLLQLRDRYNGDWKADWSEDSYKFVILSDRDKVIVSIHNAVHRVMHFKTEELRNQFLENFRDLLEIAKPLL